MSETQTDMSGKCYQCRHRGDVPGDAHSCCRHPDIQPAERGHVLAMIHGVPDIGAAGKLGIQANAHGVRSGWFAWPHNFDPLWLIHCDGFEAKS